jgi:hypothetical protein
MALTTEQRERLIGMVLLGTSSDTACACLGVSAADVLAAEDADQSFAQALYLARFARDAFERELEDLAAEDD